MSRPPVHARIAAHLRARRTARILSSLSDAQLADAGIRRFDIPRHALEAAPAPALRGRPAAEGIQTGFAFAR